MQRKEDESFEMYKIRRAASNFAVKQINAKTKGGKGNNRDNRLYKGVMVASYGEVLRAHFAKKRLELINQRKGK